MKKLWKILTIFILCAICSACNNTTDSNRKTDDGGEVPFSQFETDVSNLSYIKNGIIDDNNAGPYTVIDIVVDKRQTNLDKKNDIIYCSVTISNKLYESNVYIKLIYNQYNGNVWTLDENELIREQCFSKPLKCFTASNLLRDTEPDSFYYGELEIPYENIKHVSDENLITCDIENYTYKQTSHYKITSNDGIFGADASVDYYFDPEKGWENPSNSYLFYNINIDRIYCLNSDKILGKFKKDYQKIGFYQEYLEFYNYNSKNNMISYCYTNAFNEKIKGNAVLDIKNMLLKDDNYTFFYDVEDEDWYKGESSYFNSERFYKIK